jgi:hypothetical protein
VKFGRQRERKKEREKKIRIIKNIQTSAVFFPIEREIERKFPNNRWLMIILH